MKHFHFIQYPPLPSPMGNKNGKEIVFLLILTIKTPIRSPIHGVGGFEVWPYYKTTFLPDVLFKNVVRTCISSNKFMVCHYTFQYAMSMWSWNPYYLPLWSKNCLSYRSTWDRPWVFSAVRVVDSLVFCVVFCRHCLSFSPFLSLHCLPFDLKLYENSPLICSKYSYKVGNTKFR